MSDTGKTFEEPEKITQIKSPRLIKRSDLIMLAWGDLGVSVNIDRIEALEAAILAAHNAATTQAVIAELERLAALPNIPSVQRTLGMNAIYKAAIRDRIAQLAGIEKEGGEGRTIEGIKVHDEGICEAPCPFHAPSDHPLKDAAMHVRVDKGCLVERICEHGVGHDDPDSVAFMHRHGQMWAGVHGCCGCCQ